MPPLPPVCTPLASPAGGLALVHGRIVDPTGAVIPHALARLKTTADDHSSYAKADDAGCYQIATVPGNYILQASSQGFAIPTKSIAVTTDQDNSFDQHTNVAYSGLPLSLTNPRTPPRSASVLWTRWAFPLIPSVSRFKPSPLQSAPIAASRTLLLKDHPRGDAETSPAFRGVNTHLTADAPGFVRVRALVSEHTYVNQTVNMTPLPVKP